MDKYRMEIKVSDKKLTEKQLKEARDIMTTIIARYIVNNRK